MYGAVERTRTSTVLLPPAPQAGASASSATTAQWRQQHSSFEKRRSQVRCNIETTAFSAASRRAAKLPEAAARVAASPAAGHRVVSLWPAQLAAVQPELRVAWPAPSSPPAWKHFAAPTRRPALQPYPYATPSPWRTP